MARHINNIVAWSFVLFGVTMVLFGVVRSTGAVMAPLVMLFIAIWLVRLPFATWLIPTYGAEAIWWSFPLGSVVLIVLGARHRHGHARHGRCRRQGLA
ncbi:MATE family efflux transporter [Herbaspirillum lusitanum]|uniref:MATE family efflux transporter n=1 Tax=Herbaspirillum lusitanum TaxID=213312 RepID=UPI00036DF5D3